MPMHHRILSTDLLFHTWNVEADTPTQALLERSRGGGHLENTEWKGPPGLDGILIPVEGFKPSQAICTAAAVAANVFVSTLAELGQIEIFQAQLEEESLEQSLLSLGRNLLQRSTPRRQKTPAPIAPPPSPPSHIAGPANQYRVDQVEAPPFATPSEPIEASTPETLQDQALLPLQSSILQTGRLEFDSQGWVVLPGQQGRCHPEAAMQAMAALLQALSARLDALAPPAPASEPTQALEGLCAFCQNPVAEPVKVFGTTICGTCVPSAWDANWRVLENTTRTVSSEYGRAASLFPHSPHHARVVREAQDALRDETRTPAEWSSDKLDDIILDIGS
jgi:hypothetical protein